MNKFDSLFKQIITEMSQTDFDEEWNSNIKHKVNTMKIDELIEKLQTLKEKHGNIEVKALDYDGDATDIDEVEFDSYENAICIALPRTSYF